jgi:invasion protein IalB
MGSRIRCLGLAALLLLAGSAGALAQQDAATAGDAASDAAATERELWSSRCVAGARGASLDCAIEQRAFVSSTRQLLAAVKVRVPGDTGKPILMVQTALGVYLPAGVALSVDGLGSATLELQMCDGAGCYAFAPLAEAMLDGMRRGDKLNLSFQDMKKQTIKVPMSLAGFSAAYKKIQ